MRNAKENRKIEMVIDLKRFREKKLGIAPVLNGRGIYRGRKFRSTLPDGWYEFDFGDIIKQTSRVGVTSRLADYPRQAKINGFVYQDSFVPGSFNTMVRKFWVSDTLIRFYLGNPRPWTGATFIRWEDGNFYFLKAWMQVPRLFSPSLVDEIKPLSIDFPKHDIKDITPELRFYTFLFIMDKIKEEELKKIKEREELLKTLGGRIRDAIESVGGRFINHLRTGKNRVEVAWQMGGYKFNTLIDENLGIKEAGLCLGQTDKLFTMKSLVLRVQDHIKEQDYLNITRERE